MPIKYLDRRQRRIYILKSPLVPGLARLKSLRPTQAPPPPPPQPSTPAKPVILKANKNTNPTIAAKLCVSTKYRSR